MTNYVDRNLEQYGEPNPASERKRLTYIAHDLAARARGAEFGLPQTDLYAEVALREQMISKAQNELRQTASGDSNIAYLDPQTAVDQARLLSRPAHEFNVQDAA